MKKINQVSIKFNKFNFKNNKTIKNKLFKAKFLQIKNNHQIIQKVMKLSMNKINTINIQKIIMNSEQNIIIIIDQQPPLL